MSTRVKVTYADIDGSLLTEPEYTVRAPWWLWPGALVVLALAGFAVSLPGTFLPQDEANVTENPFLRAWFGVRALWRFFYNAPQAAPLGYTLLLAEYQAWGGAARHAASGYRLVSLLLHTGNGLLVWLLLKQMKFRGAFFVAALFLVHPATVQSVAWVSQQPTLLAGFLGLVSLILLARYFELTSPPVEPRWLKLPQSKAVLYALALLCFLLAITARPIVAVLPLLLLLMGGWKKGRVDRAMVRPLIPHLLVALATAIGAAVVLHHQMLSQPLNPPLAQRFAGVGQVVLFYVVQLFRPWNSSFVHRTWGAPGLLRWMATGGILIVIGMTWHFRKRVGCGLFAVTVGLVLLLLPQVLSFDAAQYRGTWVADSALYFPSIWLLAGLVGFLAQRFGPRDGEWTARFPILWVGLVALLGLLVFTNVQALNYRSSRAIWEASLSHSPRSLFALNALAAMEMAEGDSARAFEHLQKVFEIDPDSFEAHQTAGLYYESIQQWDRAYAQYYAVLRRESDNVPAICGVARCKDQQGDHNGALAEYARALAIRPGDPIALNDMGLLYLNLGENEKGEDCFRRSIKAAPNFVPSYISLANLNFRRGNFQQAVDGLYSAARIDPTNFVVHLNLGTYCATLSQLTQDAKQKQDFLRQGQWAFRNALFYNPNSAQAAFNLAVALASDSGTSEQGGDKMKEALFYFNKAAQLEPKNLDYQNKLERARQELRKLQQ